ncbi:MAG TPA: SGNH/GDSL hydrolase family protein [Candidatus Saccharimonadales bacterium]|nr:SGNH/GDSL hydrolase family protein [Candidatus Saccharimonadales bacterium]
MAQAKLKNIIRGGLFAVAAIVSAIVPSTQAVYAATTYTQLSLAATVNGTSVSATATIKASTQTTAQYAGICVRDASGNNLDFTKASNVTIRTTSTTLNGPQKTFNPGTYTYSICIQVRNVWYQVGAAKTFTVANPDPGPGTPPPTTPPAGSSYGNNALAQWNAAVANRATTTATWVAWGDSFTEGQGASTMQNRWVNKVLTSLRTTFPTTGVTGGVGYLPAFYETYGPDSTWTPYTGMGGSGSWIENEASLGNRLIRLNPGGYEVYTVTGSSVDILYSTGGGTFTYKIDSGSAVPVNTAGTYSPTGRTRVTFPTVGSHKVTITSTSGAVSLHGIMAYNGDENAGIRLYEAAHSGAKSSEFVATATGMAQITAASKADLVTIELGPNDFLHGPTTPAGVTANLQSIVASIRQASTAQQPSIVIVVPWSFSSFSSPTGYTWQQYADAMRSVAAADTSLGLLDLTSLSPSGLLAPDGLHASNAGHTAIGNAVMSYLVPTP